MFLIGGCDKDGTGNARFTLHAVYDTIQSYPGGGGLFLLYYTPLEGFDGIDSYSLSGQRHMSENSTLHQLADNDTVFELLVKPDLDCSLQDQKIGLTVYGEEGYKKINLVVSVVDNGVNEEATGKLNEFKSWLTERDSSLGALLDSDYFLYKTYLTLVVEHYTVLTDEYEIRFCYHVMIPPDDWSMIRVRKRNVLEPEFAARRESDGTINEIPVSEYPSMFGY